ncbi:MAG: hypothetical protein AVDCRST_MAG38-303 [uncultured Solirubrobacteraceae bacterium]|uniref:Uncharacterized protein n=1 Tax=uncultured Solirubrobacteraceae bacterium TaxID=1162706 RepID=A0A6J4R4Q9_9ACTN|nr:MAG: hypothetical protein AVDCRST_MAG38-303 [uncultured Solirubrobacteraceae bacterium]
MRAHPELGLQLGQAARELADLGGERVDLALEPVDARAVTGLCRRGGRNFRRWRRMPGRSGSRPGPARIGGGHRRRGAGGPRRPGSRRGTVVRRRSQPVGVALLLLAGPPAEAIDQPPVDQDPQHRPEGLEVGEGMQPLRALAQLSRRLRASQHEHRQDRLLGRVEGERLVEQMAELGRATALRAGQAGVASASETGQGLADLRLVVVDDGVAVGGLVAGQAQRVEAERIGVGRRALLLEQGSQDPDLDVVQLHAPSVMPGRGSLRRVRAATRDARSALAGRSSPGRAAERRARAGGPPPARWRGTGRRSGGRRPARRPPTPRRRQGRSAKARPPGGRCRARPGPAAASRPRRGPCG